MYENKIENIFIFFSTRAGYCRDVAHYLIKDCEETSITYNPEFIAQGDIMRGLVQPDLVLIGIDAARVAARLVFCLTFHCH